MTLERLQAAVGSEQDTKPKGTRTMRDYRRNMRGRVCASAMALVMTCGAFAFRAPCATGSGTDWPPPEGSACQPNQRDADEAQTLYELGKAAHLRGQYASAFHYYREAYVRDCRALLLLTNMAKVLDAEGHYAEALEVLRLYRARRRPVGDEQNQLDAYITSLGKKAEAAAAASGEPSAAPRSSAVQRSATEPPPSSSAPSPPPPRPTAQPPSTDDQRPRRSTVPAWITMGAGGATMIVGGVLAGVGGSAAGRIGGLRSEIFEQNTCLGATCAADRADADAKLSRAQDMRTVGFVMLGIGGAAIVGGLCWYLWAPKRPEADEVRAHVRVVPWGQGVGLVGAF